MTELLFPLGGRRAWAVWLTAVFTYLVTVLHRGSMSVAGLQAAERFDISASALASFTVVQLTVYAAMQVAPARMDRSLADHRELVEALAGTSAKRFRDLIASHVHNAAAHLRGTAK